MSRNLVYKALFVATLVTFSAVVAALVIQRHEPQYHGHSFDVWFDSTNRQETAHAFSDIGAKALPFLVQKLHGQAQDRIKACLIISDVFQTSQVENSEIPVLFSAMLTTGGQGEQLAVYTAMKRLGLTISDSDIVIAERTCPSIKASEEEAVRQIKFAQLYSLTNSLDCNVVAKLCNDADPQVQMSTLTCLRRLERTRTNDNLCSEVMGPALLFLVKNTTNASVLGATLGYISSAPVHIHEHADTIYALLETTKNSNLEMQCLSLIAAATRDNPLSEEAKRALKLIGARYDTDSNVRREATDLLSAYSGTRSRN